ncbi:MAG: hypothetical protein H7Y42_03770 [Chitinophagaceae bacterium]|nr:hypothetical protein [Chitinophagaceae bacterium]
MASNSGLGLATGSKWKFNTPTSTMLPEEKAVAWTKDIKKQDPNIYAIAAMALAILGLILSLSNNRLAVNGAIACGALSAISLIGLMIDLKRKSKDFMKEINETSDSYDVGEYTQINLVFTPWSYVCTIALLTAAFLSYRRLKLLGNRSTTS